MHKTWRKYLWVLDLQNGKIDCAIRNYAKNEGATRNFDSATVFWDAHGVIFSTTLKKERQ